jgi:hypothetical protein
MKSSGPLKHFALAFLIAVVVYAAFYNGIEHRRTFRGPWRVAFTNNAAGFPELVVSQPKLRITNLTIDFSNEKLPLINSNSLMVFDIPHEVPLPVPFGQCIFMDTTFLPGTVTFNIFGHEIELLPRVLIINKKEYPWQSRTNVTITQPGIFPMSSQKTRKR